MSKKYYVLSDKETILGCLENDSKSQRALYDKYVNSMKTLCLRYVVDNSEADDVLQKGFILMFAKLKDFKFEGSFEGWLRRIMINTALKHLKKNKRIFIENIDEKINLHNSDPTILSKLSEQELLKLLYKLPSGYRTVFNMFVIEGYSHKEIGKELNIKASSSRSQLVKAKNALKKLIEENY